MTQSRLLLVWLVICACAIPLRVVASSDHLPEGEYVPVPLPVGRGMSDEELLEVEGELALAPVFLLLIKVAAAAVVMGGGTAVHQNWLDEDYGIDRDDLGVIGRNTFMVFTGGFVNGCTHSCTHSVFGPSFVP